MRKLLPLAALCLLIVPAASAKKPHQAAVAGPTVSASYDASLGAIVLTGCGFAFPQVAGVKLTEPDGTVVTEEVGMWSSTCLDNNYTLVSQPGGYHADVYQCPAGSPTDSGGEIIFDWSCGVVVASTDVTV